MILKNVSFIFILKLFFLSLCYKNDNIQKLSVSYYMMIIIFQNTMNHTQFLDAGAGISEDSLSD